MTDVLCEAKMCIHNHSVEQDNIGRCSLEQITIRATYKGKDAKCNNYEIDEVKL